MQGKKFSWTLYLMYQVRKPFTIQLVEIQSICIGNLDIAHNIGYGVSYKQDKKCCGKSRKYWLAAFSQCPTTFSKGLFVRVVKSDW